MSNGCRTCYALAVAWLSLTCASEPAADGDRPAKGRAALLNVSAAPKAKMADSPNVVEERCTDKDGKRGDCNVIATQAAVEQALDADWQTNIAAFGFAIGSLTLVAAFVAARWAKIAAQHTEAGAIEARRSADIAHASSRPWINISPTMEVFVGTKHRIEIRVRFNFENIGVTVATNCYTRCHITVNTSEKIESVKEVFERYIDTNKKQAINIIPRGSVGTTSANGQVARHFNRYLVNDRLHIKIIAICLYTTADGVRHESSGQWRLVPTGTGLNFNGGFDPEKFPAASEIELVGGLVVAN